MARLWNVSEERVTNASVKFKTTLFTNVSALSDRELDIRTLVLASHLGNTNFHLSTLMKIMQDSVLDDEILQPFNHDHENE